MNSEIRFDKYQKKGAGYHWVQLRGSIARRNTFVIARYNLVTAQLGDSRGKQVLDIGCGDGALTSLLAQKGGLVTGIDISGEALKFAAEKMRGSGNVAFVKASAYHLPLRSGSFDYVISADTIEHLQEPDKMLAEIARLYSGNGKIVITTPLRITETPLDSMHAQEFFESDFRKLLSKHFKGDVRIIKSHPLVFMELYNRHALLKKFFNLLHLLFRYNPFTATRGWQHYAMMTAVIDGKAEAKND